MDWILNGLGVIVEDGDGWSNQTGRKQPLEKRDLRVGLSEGRMDNVIR